jgi:L-iditol 2-dehydrogenase
MKSARLTAPGTLGLVDVAAPEPGAGEVTVDLAACGICGTDLEKLRGNYQSLGRLGHEPVGRVAAVGAGVKGIEPGQRVFVHHHVPCRACPVCARGDFTFCPSYSSTNLDPGGFSERFRVPAENVRQGAVLPLDPSVDWATGSLLEPAACALTALQRVGFREGDSVFVVGLGPVGLLYLRVAGALGAGWLGGAELSGRRRAVALSGGAALALDPRDPDAVETEVRSARPAGGVDLAVVATGAPAAIRLALRLLRRGGTLNLFGLPEKGGRLDADLQALYLAGIRIVPTYATIEPDIAEVHGWLRERRIDLTGLVTHELPLARVDEAFRIAADPERSVKVAVTGPAYR